MSPIEEIYLLLNRPCRVVIIMHQKPGCRRDGFFSRSLPFPPAVGSRAPTVISPTNWAEWLKWMPGCSGVIDFEFSTEKAMIALEKAEWVFCLDFNTLARTRHMAARLRKVSATRVLIDHHQQPEADWFDYGISDTDKSSTSEMAWRDLIARLRPRRSDRYRYRRLASMPAL